ncbi:MAG: hypothetical protein V7K21_16550 [Nostoc sp.]|uniref:hypothetical protein n=1 Tax=Nostoc sp. TaxID=1180 RepID=UPI002FFAB864
MLETVANCLRALLAFYLIVGITLGKVDPNQPYIYPTIIALIEGINIKPKKEEDDKKIAKEE